MQFDCVFNLLQRELTYLVSLSPRLEHLKATCKVLTSQPVPPNFIQESLNGFLDRFKLACQRLDERHQQLKEGKYSFIKFSQFSYSDFFLIFSSFSLEESLLDDMSVLWSLCAAELLLNFKENLELMQSL